jgi:hypothetical protein
LRFGWLRLEFIAQQLNEFVVGYARLSSGFYR